MADLDAFGLIVFLHGKLLRDLSARLGTHCSGLQQAARLGRHHKLIDNALARKLTHVDIAFNVTRHVTSVYVDELLLQVKRSMGDGFSAKEGTDSVQLSCDAAPFFPEAPSASRPCSPAPSASGALGLQFGFAVFG